MTFFVSDTTKSIKKKSQLHLFKKVNVRRKKIDCTSLRMRLTFSLRHICSENRDNITQRGVGKWLVKLTSKWVDG